MATTVAVLGANGVFGRHLVPRLAAEGYNVRALVRRPEAAGVARGCGAEVCVADIFDRDGLQGALEGCDIAVNLATSLPGPSGRGTFDANDRVRREGAPIWVETCRRAGVRRIVQQSIAMMHTAGADWANEDTPYVPSDNEISTRAIAATLAMEEVIQSSGLEWLILRGALFYGPGTGLDDAWFARAAAGKLRLPGDGSDFVSLVHIADMAAATVAALEVWPARTALIVADDIPATWRDLLGYVATLVGAAPPASAGRSAFASFRVSNQRAREALSWTPRYRDYRAGLAR